MKNTFTFALLLLTTHFLLAQNSYNMGETPITTDCEGFFYDDGGNDFPGFYGNQLGSEPLTFTICPESEGCLVMEFQTFITEASTDVSLGDILYVYDGPDTNAPLIGAFDGQLIYDIYNPGRITAGSGCLTFVFDENGGFQTVGWEATWTCTTENCETAADFAPPNDCVNALLVCDNFRAYNNTGPGVEELIIQDINGCLLNGETQSVWLDIQIDENAPPNTPLTFTISPLPGGQDYDFAIYKAEQGCFNLGEPIRCTYADETFVGTLETGLRFGETDTGESAQIDNEGNPVNGFLAPIIVNPSEQYYILVNNFSMDNLGFDFTWGDEVLDFQLLNCFSCNNLVDIPSEIEVCAGESFSLSPILQADEGLFEYEWTSLTEGFVFSTEDSTLTATAPDDFLGELTFELKTTSLEILNCVQTKEITVKVISIEGLAINNLEETYCNNANPVSLNANLNGGTFFVDNIETLQLKPSLLETGIHTIRYEYEGSTVDCNGSVEELVSIIEAPVANFDASCTSVEVDENIVLTAKEQENVSYTWYVDGLAVSTDLTYIFSNSNIGAYQIALEVTSSNGCSDVSNPLEVIVGVVDIEDHELLQSLQISPNPASDLVNLSFNTSIPASANLQWYNAQGQLMEAKKLRIEANGWNYKMDVSHLAAGVYYLYLQTGEASLVEKVLILR